MTLLDIIFWLIDFSRRIEIASMRGRHDEPLLESGRHFCLGAQQLPILFAIAPKHYYLRA